MVSSQTGKAAYHSIAVTAMVVAAPSLRQTMFPLSIVRTIYFCANSGCFLNSEAMNSCLIKLSPNDSMISARFSFS